MKKLRFTVLVTLSLSLFTSCYCDKYVVGHIEHDEPLTHVASAHNSHFFFGALVTHDKVSKYISDTPNYVIENKQTFGDLVVSGLTLGIYTPTTTKFYVPKSDPNVVSGKEKKLSKAYKGYLKEDKN